ncbi:type II secretion system inner membrane protein GspF [Litoribacillus peritrichatus]|uniref:GspF family T2SS innner membrane protein variant XcpS n=1 Tax=Litoribacillus peritrichatus TaxID=718191 RepID=A0ABP7MCB4_9GAMM
MAAFDYVALDERGKEKKGVLEGDSARQIRQALRDKGFTPLSVDQAKEKSKGAGLNLSFSGKGHISTPDLSLLTRQMATLIQSGLPLEEVLQAVANQSPKASVKSMMLSIRSKVLEGHSLANALGEYPGAFPKLFRSTVAAGEHSGHLDSVLESLADYVERQQMAVRKIKMAAIYPVILSFVAIGVVVFLLTTVVPDIVEVFDTSKQELPPLTAGLIAVSDWLMAYGHFLLIFIVLLVVGYKFQMSRSEGFERKAHQLYLKLPLISRIAQGADVSRFTSTLSILTSSGVPLVESLAISSEVMQNRVLREAITVTSDKVREGASLKNALEQTGHFPPLMLYMVASGESSGELEGMLKRTAEQQERELESLVSTLVGLFEPLMLLFMGGIVMVIVMAIMMPLMNMNTLVS